MKRVVLLAVVAVIAGFAGATTYWVDASAPPGGDGSPGNPFNTVQAGIDASSNGDEVVVLPGTYVENVTFVGSGITSDFILRGSDPTTPAVVAATIIDGDLDSDPDTDDGTTLTMSGSEDDTCLVSGLTVTGGYTRTGYGGGVSGNDTQATLSYCVVSGNKAHTYEVDPHVYEGGGGGIAYWQGDILHNTISDNLADGGRAYGGGLYACHGLIEWNTVSGNDCSDSFEHLARGGGLSDCDGVIRHNTVSGNTTDGYGGGLYGCHGEITDNIISGNSGGIYACGGLIARNLITANYAGSGVTAGGLIWDNDITGNHAYVGGGGLGHCAGVIIGNRVTGNASDQWGGGFYRCDAVMLDNVVTDNTSVEAGGGFFTCDGLIAYNVISRNVTDGAGGGVINGDVRVYNNLITGNCAARTGGVSSTTGLYSNTVVGNVGLEEVGGVRFGYWSTRDKIVNCIVWGNTAPVDPQIFLEYFYHLSYSCVQDWTGFHVGVITDNPLFVADGYWTGTPGASDWIDGDYHLSHIAAGQAADSPCIDTADPASTVFGNTRTDGVCDSYPLDMGYHYGEGTDESTSPAGWLVPGWNLISFPLIPNYAVPEMVLFDAVLAGNFMRNNMYRYEPGTGYEIYCSGFYKVAVGEAYWLYLESACQCTMTGSEVVGDYEIDLASGWNLVGHPCADAVAWSACQVSDGVETKSIPDAEAAGWIDPAVYYFAGGEYRQVRWDGAGDDDSLRPWYGYWLLANQTGLTLIVSAP